jgi:hypothetical protein
LSPTNDSTPIPICLEFSDLREEHRGHDRDDGHHREELDQSEAAAPSHGAHL